MSLRNYVDRERMRIIISPYVLIGKGRNPKSGDKTYLQKLCRLQGLFQGRQISCSWFNQRRAYCCLSQNVQGSGLLT